MKYKYLYKYNNASSWEQRELKTCGIYGLLVIRFYGLLVIRFNGLSGDTNVQTPTNPVNK